MSRLPLRGWRRLWTPFVLASVWLLAPGCYRYVTNTITVLDAETEEPLQGARVRVEYAAPILSIGWSPKDSSGITDAQGQVHLRATVSRNRWPMWFVEAPGYLDWFAPSQERIAADQIAEHLRTGETGEPVALTLRRFAAPAPTLVVTVPDGYRGYVRVCPPAGRADPFSPPHQRRFEIATDEHGLVQEPSAPIFLAFGVVRTYEFRFQDGTPIALNPPHDARAVTPGGGNFGAWGIWYVDSCPVFLLAEESTAVAERRALWPSGVYDESTQSAFEAKVHRGPLAPDVEHDGDPDGDG